MQRQRVWLYVVALPCLWGMRFLPQQTQYVHQNEHQDYLSSNLPSGTDIPFSAALQARLSV